MSESEQAYEDKAETADERKRPGLLKRVHDRLHSNPLTGLVTKIVVTLIGAAVILVGIVLSGPGIPGPGFLVILAGLGILSAEWEWARRLLHWLRQKVKNAAEKASAVDPAVRRRRLFVTGVAIVAVAAAVIGYLVVYDWPTFAVSGWDWVQDLSGSVPELPGM